ncbi:MAG: GtrA family protein [Clostridia bacterium]|nr:GtrA family protein [Clostridia bacterium]
MKKIFDGFIELYKKYEEIINYLLTGGIATVISLGVKYGLLFTVLDAKNPIQLQISVIISWLAAVVFAYITNRKFVFKSKNNNVKEEMIKFFSARIATLAMEAVLMWFFVTLLKMDSDMQVVIWVIITQGLVIVGNYILSKLFVFKDKGNNK